MYSFKPTGVCAKEILFDVKEGKISDLRFVGGCPGSLEAITRLLDGQCLDNVIDALSGVTCGKKNTSCPDQLTKALADIRDGKGELFQAAPAGAGMLNPFA